MSAKMEYSGSDVAEAIKKACEKLKVSQDQLEIEIKSTGSAGIFGLCRRKATIQVSLKKEASPSAGPSQPGPSSVEPSPVEPSQPEPSSVEKIEKAKPKREPRREPKRQPKAPSEAKPEGAPAAPPVPPREPAVPVTPEGMETARQDLSRLLEMTGFASPVTASQEEGKLHLHIGGDHVEEIIGPAGQTLDAIQYLLRKMLGKKLSEKIHLNIDAGDFREARAQELEEAALQLAREVKESGKTQSIPALNPAERRIVHMVLQDDTSIRSRSVGEGLFKKVLIYLPGKGRKRGGRNSRGTAKTSNDQEK
ncbi:MAG: Jag N-terminal domain-containing protein [Desulfobulbaceae bacterium]|nr:Jag N-terminal domain-containing protein [Desulfobulbaceae bacterium]